MINLPYTFSTYPSNTWDNITKLSFLQRRVIIYSILYYSMDQSILSDQEFDALGRQLVDLMNNSTKEEKQKSRYWYAMDTFDGSTGFYIYSRLNKVDREYLSHLAGLILENWKKK